jgi:hypothetical protein
MKKLYILLLCSIHCVAYGSNATFTKLTEVNKCWIEQADVVPSALPSFQSQSEKEWIRTHLSLVERILRNRNTNALSETQRINRLKCLDYLHGYWQAGNFPINDELTYRTPIFIDKYNNFCAVGFLVKATGHEDVSRMISARTNLAYVRDMQYPELDSWAKDNGFTKDELAWIQPWYGPVNNYCGKIGHGVNGSIKELFVDNDQLYVGGIFTLADSSLPVGNMAYVTEDAGLYTWHDVGGGVNGPVYAITKFGGNLFVAGSFTLAGGVPVSNIAYWDGTSWHAAGCTTGVIYDLAVFSGSLYAGGNFDVCTGPTEVNFAKWDGSAWLPVPGIIGTVNTLEPVESPSPMLFIGGNFNFDTSFSIVALDATSAFHQFGDGIPNEVMTFMSTSFGLSAGCKQTSATDTMLLWRMSGAGTLVPDNASLPVSSLTAINGQRSLNALYYSFGGITAGGEFSVSALSRKRLYASGGMSWGALDMDSTVNKIVNFKSELVFAGEFKSGNDSAIGSTVLLNGIAKIRASGGAFSVHQPTMENEVHVYPNPVRSGTTLKIENKFNANHYTLNHITGRLQAEGILDKTQQISLRDVPSGFYIILLANEAGERVMQKIVVE